MCTADPSEICLVSSFSFLLLQTNAIQFLSSFGLEVCLVEPFCYIHRSQSFFKDLVYNILSQTPTQEQGDRLFLAVYFFLLRYIFLILLHSHILFSQEEEAFMLEILSSSSCTLLLCIYVSCPHNISLYFSPQTSKSWRMIILQLTLRPSHIKSKGVGTMCQVGISKIFRDSRGQRRNVLH